MMRKTFQTALIALLTAMLLPTGSWAQSARTQLMRQLKAKSQQRQCEVLPRQMELNRYGLTLLPQAFAPLQGARRAPLVAADGTVLFGNMNYANYWQSRQNSFYTFKAQQADADFSNITNGQLFSTNGGGILSADKLTYHLIEYVQTAAGEVLAQYAEVDATTWTTTRTQEVTDLSLLAFDLTRDPQSGKVYGAFINSQRTGYELGAIDYTTLTRTTVGSLSKVVVGLAANSQGQLYAIATDGNLYRVNKQNAQLTLVGSLGVSVAQYQQSATFSSTKDAIYWTRFDQGQSGLYEVDPATGKAQLISSFASNEQIVALEEWLPAVEAEAPGKPEGFSVSFNAEKKTAEVSFTVPTTTHDGGVMTGDVEAHVLVNGAEAVTTTLAAGQSTTLTVELQKDGNNSIAVYLSNEAGRGEQTEPAVGFVGNDLPQVDALTATLAISGEGLAEVGWTAPTESQHGGYFDPAKLTYRLTRHTENGEAATAEALTTAGFSESLPTETMHIYWYAVEVDYDGQVLTTLYTNKVRAGEAVDVPFTATFDNDNDFHFFDVSDLNADNNTWYWYEMMHCAAISWAEENHNDLLLSPAFRLLPRNYYRISYRIKQLNSEHTEAYKATWGPADADPLTYTYVLEETSQLKDYQYRTVEKIVMTEEPMTYRLAFQALTPSRQGVIYVDDVKVEHVASFDAPGTPIFFSCIAAEKGQLSASLHIQAPNLLTDSSEMTDPCDIVIKRGDEVIAEITGVEPAEVITYTDNSPANGYNTYTVFARNDAGESAKTEKTVYVGYDVPDSPTSINLNDDGSQLTLTWNAPDEQGPRGGYVDADGLTYNVGMAGESELVAQNISERQIVRKNDFTGEQRLLYYGVQAKNSIGEGNWGLSNPLIVGDSYELPFRESFPGQNLNYPFWLIDNQDASIASDLAQDGDGGAMVIQTPERESAQLTSGKINIAPADNPVLSFYYALMPSKGALQVLLTKDGSLHKDELAVIDLSKIQATGGDVEWKKVVLPLTDYKDCRYAQLIFHVYSSDHQPVAFDNIRVEDRVANDAAATSLQAPSEAIAGDTIEATASVRNMGYRRLANLPVRLTLNGRTVATQHVETLEPDEELSLTFRVPVTAATQSPATLSAEVMLEGDPRTDDNVVSTQLNVTTVGLPTVTDLTGSIVESEPNTVELTWSRPDYQEPTYTTDDVEQYELWTYDQIGRWTTYNDNPGWPTAALTDATFPHMGEEFTAIVFDASLCDAKAAHSGSQCFAIFDNDGWAGDYGSNCEYTNKYLISPELSGEAQTIKFFVSSAVEWAPETFEVVYSTGSDYFEDFTSVAYFSGLDAINSPGQWQEVSVDLPAGARFFAIHCTSTYSYALLVDDITFASKQQQARQRAATNAIEGYNVYRNGIRLNKQLVTDTHYRATFHTTDAAFQVSTVYTRGEAALSNVWQLNIDGIRQIENGELTIENSAVYDLSGRRIQSNKVTKSQGNNNYQLPKGVYIINGRKTVVR